MIKYSLVCRDGHEFEAWFQSSAAYEAQVALEQVMCPRCASHDVDKAVMAPAVARRAEPAPQPGEPRPALSPQEMLSALRKLRQEVHAKAEYVGGRFAEEARRIYFDEGPARGIYGEATSEEARELASDGIPFFPLPRLPEDFN